MQPYSFLDLLVFHDYVERLIVAIKNGFNARGYFTRSFLDNFKGFYVYEMHFGLYYMDFKDINLKRYPNLSSSWYTNFLKRAHNHRSTDLVVMVMLLAKEHDTTIHEI